MRLIQVAVSFERWSLLIDFSVESIFMSRQLKIYSNGDNAEYRYIRRLKELKKDREVKWQHVNYKRKRELTYREHANHAICFNDCRTRSA